MNVSHQELQDLNDLLAEDGGTSHWLGHSQKHGWLLLDRDFPGNEPGFGGDRPLRFLRLSDWKTIVLSASRWNHESISFYRGSVGSKDISNLLNLLFEWRRRREAWIAPKRWKAVVQLLSKRAIQTTRVPPVAVKEDILLCFMWSNMLRSIDMSLEHLLVDISNTLGPYHASRLISARRAERVATDFYIELGSMVKDVSITQLRESCDYDWKNFDLDVGYPIDVKNTRSTYNGGKHFAEHAVARFKEERIGGREVRLAGVRSPYLADPKSAAMDVDNAEATLLGEVSFSEIGDLRSWMDTRFGHILITTQLWLPKRLPGWLFEYPDLHYTGRKGAIELMESLVQKYGASQLLSGQWLIAEASGVSLCTDFSTDPWLVEMRDLFLNCGLAKRCLILYAMCATLEAVMRGKDASAIIAQLRELANVGTNDNSTFYPLGLEDPLGYVDRFFSAFQSLGIGLKPFVKRIRSFRILGPDILVADMEDGHRLTMLAYCGGWLEHKGRCGSAPLVVGIHEHCSECERLVCTDCFFCSERCQLGGVRKVQKLQERPQGSWAAYVSDEVEQEYLSASEYLETTSSDKEYRSQTSSPGDA